MDLYNEHEEKHIEEQEHEGACFTLDIALNKLHEVTSVRLGSKQELVDEYAGKMKDGETLPPIIAFFDEPEKKHWIGDGVYRKRAALQNGETHYPTIVYRGTWRDALACSVEENTKNGDRLTNEEKVRAVWLLVEAFQDGAKSITQIAKLAGVAQSLVSKIKKQFDEQKAAGLSHLGDGIEAISTINSDTDSPENENQTELSDVETKPVWVERKGKAYPLKPNNQHTKKAKVLSHEEWLAKSEERRQEKHDSIIEKAIKEQCQGVLGPFTVIYADPPWKYDIQSSSSRAVENHYPTLTLEDLCNLDVASICGESATLYLWVTAPMLEEGLELARAWGFKHKIQDIWHKLGGLGMGHRNRVDHELLFTCVRGNFPTPTPRLRASSIWPLPRGRHSAKPKEFREQIAKLFPNHPKVELFARETAPGWTSIGNEIDGRDIREVIQSKNKQELH